MFWKVSTRDNTPRCSFCQRWEANPGEFIVSPSCEEIFICQECVAVCMSILTDRRSVMSETGLGSDEENVA